MTKVLYDALYPAGIPLDIAADALVASYVDHPEVDPPCMTQLAARFPNNVNVSISAHGHLAQIYDVESGAIDVESVPNLLLLARAQGITPVVYCAPRTRPGVEDACNRVGVLHPMWWCVQRAGAPFIPDGWDGNQWLGAGPYDQSIISDPLAQILTGGGHIPSGGGTPIPPAPEEIMARPIVSIYQNAEWMVAADLTSRVWIQDDVNVYVNDTANYVVRNLPDAQMAVIPVVGAAPPITPTP